MKINFILPFIFSAGLASAQVPDLGNTRYVGEVLPDRTFTDCQGNIYSLNDFLAQDKPLVIFNSTVDCGYCIDEAPEVSQDIIKYKDKINFLFFLGDHNTYPRCAANGNRTFDYPDDWRNNFPGYKNTVAIGFDTPDHFLLSCEITTSFGLVDNFTNKILAGGCRHGGRENAINAALKMYEDGKLTQYASQVTQPTISSSGSGNSRNISIDCSTSGAEIFYTTDGTTPNKNSKKYNGTFQITRSGLVKAQAIKAGMHSSPVKAIYVDINNTNFVNIAREGQGYEWTNIQTLTSNATARSFSAVNDGKLEDVAVNGGNEGTKDIYVGTGVIWNEVKTGIKALKLIHRTPQSNGEGRGFFAYGMKIQTTQDGNTWADLNIGHYPEYPYGNYQSQTKTDQPTYFFLDEPISARGVRVIGMVALSNNWGWAAGQSYGLKEFEIFKDNTVTSLNESEDISNQELVLFPNPSVNEVNIMYAAADNTEMVEVLDAQLKSVMFVKTNFNHGSANLDLSVLTNGIYYVKIDNRVSKLVISK